MAKGIMIQGTMSGAGKSFLVAGLLRILSEDGYKVAPFKSQNMALNSYITKDGLEIGRAQAMQAEAARMEVSVDMNPILLKPTNDVGSQVIVSGEVLGNMKARDYFAYKVKLIPEILSAYERLSQKADIIVIEGAGSPAEINLKQNDIVNMGLATMLDVPVLLAGDIDRGGVFAQLYGTIALLEQEERQRVRGLLINKFRGDKSILDPGIRQIEKLTHKPVLGTIPYMDVDIEEEDSLSERLEKKGNTGKALLKVGVLRFPRISNYTDFAPLEMMEEVEVTYIHRRKEMTKQYDLLILPGSKNTMSDLLWLRQEGLEAEVFKAASKGTLIIGICGGFQMLGKRISDVEGVEQGGTIKGLGLLPIETFFGTQKVRTQMTGALPLMPSPWESLSSLSYEGYEIHMGVSNEVSDGGTCIKSEEGRLLGVAKENVLGTYLHGFFDAAAIGNGLANLMARRKGISIKDNATIGFTEYKELQYQKLASTMREHLDMEKIYKLLEEQR